MLFRTSGGGKRKEHPGGTGSATDRTEEDLAGTPPKKRKKTRVQRLREQLAGAKAVRAEIPGPQGKGSGKGGKGHPRRDPRGRFVADRAVVVVDPEADGSGGCLETDEGYVQAVDAPGLGRRDWVHMVPALRTFGRGTQPKEKRGRRDSRRPEGYGDPTVDEENLIAERGLALGEKLCARGEYFSFEHPSESYLWELKAGRRALKSAALGRVKTTCAVQGAVTVLTNAPWLLDGDAGAEEGAEGGVEEPAARYDRWARRWARWLQGQAPGPAPGPADRYVKRGKFQNILVRQELAQG